MDHYLKKRDSKTERVAELGRKTKEENEIQKWNQMTALRILTGRKRQTPLASLWGL